MANRGYSFLMGILCHSLVVRILVLICLDYTVYSETIMTIAMV